MILLVCSEPNPIEPTVTQWCAPRACGSLGYGDHDLSDLPLSLKIPSPCHCLPVHMSSDGRAHRRLLTGFRIACKPDPVFGVVGSPLQGQQNPKISAAYPVRGGVELGQIIAPPARIGSSWVALA